MASKTALTLLQISLLFGPLVLAQETSTTEVIQVSGFTISFGYIPTSLASAAAPTYTPSFGVFSSATINPTNAAGSGWAFGSSPACYAGCQAYAYQNIPPACGITNQRCQCDPAVVAVLQECLQSTCSSQDLPLADKLLLSNCPSADIPSVAVPIATTSGNGAGGSSAAAQASTAPATSASPTPGLTSGSSSPSVSSGNDDLNPSAAPDSSQASGATSAMLVSYTMVMGAVVGWVGLVGF